MPWRTLIGISLTAGVTITLFEYLLLGHTEGFFVQSHASLLRATAITAAAASLLCFVTGLLGASLNRVMSVSCENAMASGVVAAALPAAAYLAGIEVSWAHDSFLLWFVLGAPVVFVISCLAIRGMPSRALDSLSAGWPAIAPLAAWTVTTQVARQNGTLVPQSVMPAAVFWAVGCVAIVLLIQRHPRVGHLFTTGVFAGVLIGAVALPVRPDLNRPDTLIGSADASATPIILLTVDTLRRDALSVYGSPTPTPALESLAADSVIFDRAYSTAPWTYVSFTSIHSGLTPWGHGVRRLTDRITRRLSALAPTVRDRGYNTAAIGFNQLLMAGGPARELALAFHDYAFFPRILKPRTRAQSILRAARPDTLGLRVSSQQLGEYGTEWVRNHKSAPFLLWLHFYDPHDPYELVEQFPPAHEPPSELGQLSGRDLRAALDLGTGYPGFREWARARYDSEVQLTDQAIGRFLQSLKEEGLYDETLIIFASDHGEEFAEHDGYHHDRSLHNELVRVPLFVKLPNAQMSLRSSGLVSTVAIMPTILDLAGIPYDEAMYSAESLRSAWEQPASIDTEPTAAVFMTGVNRSEPAEAVVWENYKYIRWENMDREELYEFESDPNERYNLAREMPDHVAVGQALLADHAAREAKRAAARGFEAPSQESLTPVEEEILRGLGYLQ